MSHIICAIMWKHQQLNSINSGLFWVYWYIHYLVDNLKVMNISKWHGIIFTTGLKLALVLRQELLTDASPNIQHIVNTNKWPSARTICSFPRIDSCRGGYSYVSQVATRNPKPKFTLMCNSTYINYQIWTISYGSYYTMVHIVYLYHNLYGPYIFSKFRNSLKMYVFGCQFLVTHCIA